MVVTLANVLLRQAEKTDNPRQYLDDIIAAKLGTLSTQNGQIVSTTVNGKSMTLQVPAGATLPQYIAAAELALSYQEAGIARVPRQTWAVAR